MRSLGRGIIDFVVGDDVGIALAVLIILAATAAVAHLGGEAWWLLPLGVPISLWTSLRRAQRRAQRSSAPRADAAT